MLELGVAVDDGTALLLALGKPRAKRPRWASKRACVRSRVLLASAAAWAARSCLVRSAKAASKRSARSQRLLR